MIAFLLTLSLAGTASAAGSARTDAVAEARAAFEARRYDAVIGALSEEAIQKLKAKQQARAYELRGLAYERLGRYDDALRTLQVAAAIFPKDLVLLTELAGLLQRSGLDERARPFYARVIQIHPNNAASHFGLGQIERKNGFLDRAADHYEMALNEWSSNPQVWREFAEVLSARGDHARAIAAVQRSLSLDDTVDSQFALARFQFAAKTEDAAFATLEAVIQRAPDRSELRLQGALWRIERGELDLATTAAESVLKTLPGDPLAHCVRGMAAMKRGDRIQALKDFELSAGQKDAPFTAEVSRVLAERLRTEGGS